MIPPNSMHQVSITVENMSTAMRLSVGGLSSGVRALFYPDVVTSTHPRSTLLLISDSTSANMNLALTVMLTATSTSSAASIMANLQVRVTACPYYAIPTNCPPVPTGGSGQISGTLSERTVSGTRPIAGRKVWAWVQMPNYGYSSSSGPTDTNGKFWFPSIPATALVIVNAGGQEYTQPCAAIVQLTGVPATVDLELVSMTNPIFESEPPINALTGVAYRATANGREPVRNAIVFFESSNDIVIATTSTDEQGRYSLCRLPGTLAAVTAWMPGLRSKTEWVTLTGRKQLDLAMMPE